MPSLALRILVLGGVANVGLSFEQPSTIRGRGQDRLIYQMGWSAGFLRLARHTGDATFETYARNAVIGRSRRLRARAPPHPAHGRDGESDGDRRGVPAAGGLLTAGQRSPISSSETASALISGAALKRQKWPQEHFPKKRPRKAGGARMA